jgi:hypothetical protein
VYGYFEAFDGCIPAAGMEYCPAVGGTAVAAAFFSSARAPTEATGFLPPRRLLEKFSETMKLKSYFSGTPEAAAKLARNELGKALLVLLGAYEVGFWVVNSPLILLQQAAA